MSLDGIVEHSFGDSIQLTVVQDDVAQDISAFSERRMQFLAPDGTLTSASAEFVTDGTDGKVKATTACGQFHQRGTKWYVQVVLTTTGSTRETATIPKQFEVKDRLTL